MLKKIWNTHQMFRAAEKQQWGKVADLIEHKADIESQGGFILELLAEGEQVELLDLCLSRGLDAKYDRCILVDISIRKNNTEMLEMLLEHDKDILNTYINEPRYRDNGAIWKLRQKNTISPDTASKKMAEKITEITGKTVDDIIAHYRRQEKIEKELIEKFKQENKDYPYSMEKIRNIIRRGL